VLIVQDRQSGVIQPIGNPIVGGGTADGLAVAIIQQGPHRIPAIASEGPCTALAVPEPWEDAFDINQNGDIFNTILRVFCLDQEGIEEVSAMDLAVDTTPLILESPIGVTPTGLGGEPIVMSEGLVYFRAAEAANARQVSEIVDFVDGSTPQILSNPSISADGHVLAFLREVAGEVPAVFRHDRQTGQTTRVSVKDRASCAEPPVSLGGDFGGVVISADGLHVAFWNSLRLDFEDDLVNGQAISPQTQLENGITISSAGGTHLGPAIFDSSPLGPNAGGDDPDLLVGLGNILILQSADQPSQTVPGIFDTPDDDAGGGTVIFEFPAAVELSSIDLIDVDNAAIQVMLIDVTGRARAYTVPAGWTRDLAASGPKGFDTLDLTTLADQTGEGGATATVSEDPSFDPTGVLMLEIEFSGSAAMANLRFRSGSGAADAMRGVFVYDVATCRTERLSVASDGSLAQGSSVAVSISANGGLAAFESRAANLDPLDLNDDWDVFFRDRDSGQTWLASVDSNGVQLSGASRDPSLAAERRELAFANVDPNGLSRVFVRSLETGETVQVGQGDNPSISRDGTVLVFEREGEVYFHDRRTGITRRISLTSTGEEGGFPSSLSSLGDGRLVAIETQSALVPGDTNGLSDGYVIDTFTGLVKLAAPNEPDSASPVLTTDGQTVAFDAPGSASLPRAVFVRGPDPSDLSSDFSADGSLDDTVFMVLDTHETPARLDIVGPANTVAVAGLNSGFTSGPNSRVFLRRYPCGDTSCQPGLEDLGRSAPGGIAISSELLCGLASENHVVACHIIGGPGGLVDVLDAGGAPVSAEALAVEGALVAVITIPDANGVRFLRLARLNDARTAVEWIQLAAPEPARQFAMGANLVAFDQCEWDVAADLTGDNDQFECALKFFDRRFDEIVNTGQAVVPCDLQACDPKSPWRVFPESIRIVTRECDMGVCADCDDDGICQSGIEVTDRCDLTNDNDCDDLAVQQITAAGVVSRVLAEFVEGTDLGGAESGAGGLGEGLVFETVAGVCDNAPTIPCADDSVCPAGQSSMVTTSETPVIDSPAATVCGRKTSRAMKGISTTANSATAPRPAPPGFGRPAVLETARSGSVCGRGTSACRFWRRIC
jgi:Tol biopolymer transport system component